MEELPLEYEVVPAAAEREDALQLNLESWEGPLDLLLTLARSQKVDLRQISILALVEQYLTFIAEMRAKLEVAADYLVMAAWLAYLKSALLLPKDPTEDPSPDELALRLQLRLQRLAAMREAAARLLARDRIGRDVFLRPNPEGLQDVKVRRWDASLYAGACRIAAGGGVRAPLSESEPGMSEIDDRERAIEAMVFASDEALDARQIAGRFHDELTPGEVRAILQAIAVRHAGSGIELVERGGHWHFQTPADLAHLLRRERDDPRKLSRAAAEVLAIVAYHEPVSRAEIEAIRGVQTSKGTLDVLMEAEWIAPAGRREVPGRPLIYKTTDAFLQHFGLASRKDLPGIEDLRAAGLLDPVDLAFDAAMDELDLVKDGEEA